MSRRKGSRTPRKPQVGDVAYKLLCTTCHYSHNSGASQGDAQRRVGRHVAGQTTHVAVVIRETTIAVVTGTDGMDELELLGTPVWC